MRLAHILALLTAAACLQIACSGASLAQIAPADPLSPLAGPIEPRVAPRLGDDGLYHQSWFSTTFLDLAEDLGEARGEGRRFAVIFEQRGCVYCTRMHTDVLSQRYINDYVRENFRIVQLDLWGSREVTDFDGRKLTEKALAERWGVMFTPTIVFMREEAGGPGGDTSKPPEVTRMALGFGPATFLDMFVWIRTKTYERDRNFQRFHLARMAERQKPGE